LLACQRGGREEGGGGEGGAEGDGRGGRGGGGDRLPAFFSCLACLADRFKRILTPYVLFAEQISYLSNIYIVENMQLFVSRS
jgi:hypothetical protein